ncbi:MAG: hypothetical protein ACYDD1_06000 [Caulobacteraceae bacterium]
MPMSERFNALRRTSPARVESPQEPLGAKLKSYFDAVTARSPMPDQLAKLTLALENAIDDGQLVADGGSRP